MINLPAQYEKKLKLEFELINFFESLKNKPFYFCKNNIQSHFYKEDKKFILEFFQGIETKTEEFRFNNINDKTIKINNLELKILDSNIKSSNFYDNTKFFINSFCSNNFNEIKNNCYFRLIIPYYKKININYYNFFSRNKFMIPINNRIFGGIEFEFDNVTFQVYHIDNCFIIESIHKMKFDLFDKYSRDILAAFGFFTGFVPMKIGYFFAYKEFNKKFSEFLYNSNFIETYQKNTLISMNSYEYYPNQDLFFYDSKIKNIEKQLKPIEQEHFKNMLNEMNNSQDFSAIIYTYLNISNKNNKTSLNIQCASYSVLLEMITNFIANNNKEKMYFIKNKTARKELQNKLKETAKKIFNKFNLGEFEGSPIEKKIDNINAPTNIDKLLQPFEILNIPISENEKKIIRSRNDFLHGKLPIKELEFSKLSHKLFYISLKLDYLVVSLILKYINYKGIVKNLSKIYLDYLNLPELENEEYYKKLDNNSS